jgi:hypothetical protein
MPRSTKPKTAARRPLAAPVETVTDSPDIEEIMEPIEGAERITHPDDDTDQYERCVIKWRDGVPVTVFVPYQRVRHLGPDYDVHEERVIKHRRRGESYVVWQPVAKTVPVVLVVAPSAFKPAHEMALRHKTNGLNNAVKRHEENGELWFEVGRSDDQIEEAIEKAIDILRGQGIHATRDVRLTTYLNRHEW